MKFRSRQRSGASIDMTPLIDVVFILVLFFMVTTTFDDEGGIDMDLPEAVTTEPMEQPTRIVVSIDSQGGFFLDGQPMSDKTMELQLTARLKKASKEDALVVEADRQANHGAVVRVMDVARSVGINRLGISTKEVSRPVE